MVFKLQDRVLQTSTTSGLGTLDLIAAPDGAVGFVAGIGDGNQTAFTIVDAAGNWEETIGTVTAGSGGPDTITRAATPIRSSASGARVNFDTSEKTVFVGPISSLFPYFAAVPTYADDQVLQRKSGNWVVRTIANLLADLAAAGAMKGSNNLSDVADAATSRTNLGLRIGTAKIFVQVGGSPPTMNDGDICVIL